jgi:uncharacterized protein YbjQ (UPF0145 family)
MMENIDIIIALFLIALGYFAGSWAERRHYRSIREREDSYLNLPTVTLKALPGGGDVKRSVLVTGSAVISVDYFKRMLAGFRALVGGRVKSYESLIDRARREAVLRMKEQAPGATAIINVRLETTSISKGGGRRRNRQVSTVEALAYGTALWQKEEGAV